MEYKLPQNKICNFCKIDLTIDLFRMRTYKLKCGTKVYRPYSQCKKCENLNFNTMRSRERVYGKHS